MNGGDIFLFDTLNGGEIEFINGQPTFDRGLQTATYISLFSDFDWWGNDISIDEEKLQSRLNGLLSSKLTNQTRLDAIELSKAALAWMVTSGLAQTIEVQAAITGIERLEIEITITKPDNEVESFPFSVNWDNELTNPAIRRVA